VILHGVADDGTVVVVTLPEDADATVLEELDRRWPPQGLRRVDGEPDGEPASRVRLSADTTAAWDRLESDLGLFAAERVADRVAVHAALAVVDGRAIVVPGRSFTGKTTLGVALAAAGAVLASDEYALVDPATGLVTGWPRPARIRVPEGGSRREPVAAAIPPTPVAIVALLRHDAGHGEEPPLTLEPISRADAVVRILDETVCARSRPDASLDAALHLAATAVMAGRRGEAAATAAWLVAHVRDGASA
jgi:hypothetical protein